MNISGFILVFNYFKKNKTFKVAKVSLYYRVMFSLLILWSFFTIIRSFSFDSQSLITLFGHYLMGWAWLTPLAIVFGFKLSNWVFLFDYFGKLLLIVSIITLGSLFYNQRIIFGLLEWMAFLPILVLTYSIQNGKNKTIILFSIAAYLVLSYRASQRANLLLLVILGVFVILNIYKERKRHYKKIGLSLIMIIGFFVLLLNGQKYFNELSSDKDLTVDTRTFLYEELFLDFKDNTIIYGRGVLGTYYSEYFNNWNKSEEGGDSETRILIEVGYLHIILKGGVIMLILHLLILIPAAYLGIFKSKNVIAKMSGVLILAYLILWLVSYYQIYSAEYILLWMAVGTVISSRTRLMTNIDINNNYLKQTHR